MRLARGLAVLWAAALGAVWLAAPARSATLTVLGAPSKVCQLTGQTDWYSGQTTDAQTLARYGLKGVDLGFPVESPDGRLLLFFGDGNPANHPQNSYPTVPPDDVTGYTSRTAAPDATTCLDMKMFSPAPGALTHPTVTPPIQQGSFDVPTGGVAVLGTIYGFFWTNHCYWPDPVAPNPTTPLVLPAQQPPTLCPESGASNAIGRSVLASASPSNPTAFTQVSPPQMPNGFVYVTAAEPPPRHRPIPPGHGRQAPLMPIPVFGVARYRASIPYLAMAPRNSFGDVTTWSFYGGTGPSGPVWRTYTEWQSGMAGNQWAPPPGAELWADSPNPFSLTGDERCVGEHQATWNAQLGVWLMLYTCGGAQVEARTAPAPWGPWSAPTVILSVVQNPGLQCTLLWKILPNQTCPPPVTSDSAPNTFGYLYAPFVLSRFTQAAAPQGPAPAKAATIYWLVSTWDPYQVIVMQTTLQLQP